MSANTPATSPRSTRHIGSLIVFIVACELVGILGAATTGTGLTDWYQGLTKPSFQPPSWVFGPMWTVLYALMGFAVWRIWHRRGDAAARKRALTWFGAQLALNGIWSPIFFGAHATGIALIVIIALWFAVLGTILSFRKIDKTAGNALWLYLAWVSFATLLNAAIVKLN